LTADEDVPGFENLVFKSWIHVEFDFIAFGGWRHWGQEIGVVVVDLECLEMRRMLIMMMIICFQNLVMFVF